MMQRRSANAGASSALARISAASASSPTIRYNGAGPDFFNAASSSRHFIGMSASGWLSGLERHFAGRRGACRRGVQAIGLEMIQKAHGKILRRNRAGLLERAVLQHAVELQIAREEELGHADRRLGPNHLFRAGILDDAADPDGHAAL